MGDGDMTEACDLFGSPVVPGLSLAMDVVDAVEEAGLIRRIDAEDLTPFQFQGWEGKRLTRSFGTKYDFAHASLAETDPVPEWLLPLRQRAATFAGLAAAALSQVLLIRYDPGAGIGWHRDRPVYEHVVGISLGATTSMRFRRRTATGFERAAAVLEPGSAYHLAGEVRHAWEHSIAPMDRPRWSVTFRSLSDRGRSQLAAQAAG